MELELLKDWGDLKKGDKVVILDQYVIDKGFEIGLFKSQKESKKDKGEMPKK